MENLNAYYQKAFDLAWEVVPNLILAVIVLILGLWVIKLLVRGTRKAMERSKIDESLQKFLISFINFLSKILLVIIIASMVGIATTSLVAILGAAGLAIGLALQGSLSNFAGGILILLFKPFKIGDVIEAQGFVAKVSDIQIFNTILKTFDNKTIIIPNGAISNGSITNFSMESQRRVDMTFGIGYDDDIKKAKDILKNLVDVDTRILKTPDPFIVVSELGDNSVNFIVRVWVESVDYWDVYFDMQEHVKLEFDRNKISIPYPQTDVHIYQQN